MSTWTKTWCASVLQNDIQQETLGEEEADLVITRSHSLLQYNQTSHTPAVITDICDLQEGGSSLQQAGSGKKRTEDSEQTMFYKVHVYTQ